MTLAATASDPGGAVTRVEFRVDGNLRELGHELASYSFSATGLASGSHTAQATAFDNGSPSLSTATAAVPFTIQGHADAVDHGDAQHLVAGRRIERHVLDSPERGTFQLSNGDDYSIGQHRDRALAYQRDAQQLELEHRR